MSEVISISGLERPWEADANEGLNLFGQRSWFQKVAHPPRISLNGLLLCLLATILLVVSGFLPLTLPSPLGLANPEPRPMMTYSLQLPMALFVATVLGPYMGPAAVLLFIGLGLFAFPLFANGGGLAYLFQPGFGYLLGVLIMAYPLSSCFHKAFQRPGQGSRSLKVLTQALAAIGLVHGIGLAYLIGLTLAHQVPFSDLGGWMLRLSVETFPYDLLATASLLCAVRLTRLLLSLALY